MVAIMLGAYTTPLTLWGRPNQMKLATVPNQAIANRVFFEMLAFLL
ncbi:hypothetical protein [Brasilonema bromeliae]|nr:hypothetical protein [Brasilonema bromeliae]